MRENFLHYLWLHKKFNTNQLKTTERNSVQIVSVGSPNTNSGPDFFNAQLYINKQLWAGNVEVHIKSSDWYVHLHEQDKNYDNAILHVVWEHDSDVYRKDNSVIPTLELQHIISPIALANYYKLFSKKKQWINCERDFESTNDFVMNHWLERLYFERLEKKSQAIEALLKISKNNWEAVLFKMLAKNFGLKVNGEAFLSLANSFDFSILQKLQSKPKQLEALFFGQAQLLLIDSQDNYVLKLQKEYTYLKQKFNLTSQGVLPLQFFRLRPPNFPTIRLSQLAQIYHQQSHLFSKVIKAQNKEGLYTIFSVATSLYWESHFSFGKPSKVSKKKITKRFIDLLILNTIIPLKFSYAKHHGTLNNKTLIDLIQQIASEQNSIVKKFNDLKPVSNSALRSQALLQLKSEYCDKNKCLQCAIGNALLNRND